ncbi:unnamed protein product [Adineta ricciae]|uniref:Uncharacterized protein n=1 Tax=Adineta ricciae TaxID=249248 RepID=A0A813U9E9_ADIRI|nr:unnamed protein product [Adineta ricciae]
MSSGRTSATDGGEDSPQHYSTVTKAIHFTTKLTLNNDGKNSPSQQYLQHEKHALHDGQYSTTDIHDSAIYVAHTMQ